MTINIPGINAQSGLELCDGDLKIYLRSLHLYVSNVPSNMEKIRTVSTETLHDYSIKVHGIKGMSEYIGAEETRKAAKQLEEMAKAGDLTGVLAQNDAFVKQVENLTDNIRDWLKINDASGA